MKYLAGFGLLYLLIVGFLLCLIINNERLRKQHRDSLPKDTNGHAISYSEINIEGCQYLTFPMSYGHGLCHKGTCTNSIHYRKESRVSLENINP